MNKLFRIICSIPILLSAIPYTLFLIIIYISDQISDNLMIVILYMDNYSRKYTRYIHKRYPK
jgi:hypothetical protein